MAPEFKSFADAARRYCEWAEGTSHDASVARKLLIELLFEITQVAAFLKKAGVSAEKIEGEEIAEAEEFPRRKYEDWQRDFKNFVDLPFGYYQMVYSPLDLEKSEIVTFDLGDDLADIFGDLWHGLKAYDAGDAQYAAQHWVASYGYHWGHHATAALYGLDEYYRSKIC